MSVTMQKGTTTITLPDPAPGYPVRQVQPQAVGRTAGGSVYVYDKGVETFEVELPFESLTDAEKAALAGFFDQTAEGCRLTFTYTDSAGTARTTRFLDPALEFTKVCANVWDARVRLELASMAG